MEDARRTFIPAAGVDWTLPLYDPLVKMLGGDRARRSFIEQAELSAGQAVLDIGCGTGSLVILAKGLNPGAQVTGIDPDPKALERFLLKRKAADPDGFPDLSLAIIKMLGPGEYVAELPNETEDGHFGLAVKDYAHSTAPNRRFPDLVAQRLVQVENLFHRRIKPGQQPVADDQDLQRWSPFVAVFAEFFPIPLLPLVLPLVGEGEEPVPGAPPVVEARRVSRREHSAFPLRGRRVLIQQGSMEHGRVVG